MELKDRVEEILETLWIKTVEGDEKNCDFSLLRDDDAIKELRGAGFIKLADSTKVALTSKGEKEARKCVRRHRLAERLLTDVLDMKGDSVHEAGCKFEHLLREGLEENICTLLGHPRTCPHGHTIPPGDCCSNSRATPRKIVMPLSELETGRKARVAYLHTADREILKKLLAMGVYPNSDIKLQQKFPSYVFQVGKSRFAVDREMAANIFVRI